MLMLIEYFQHLQLSVLQKNISFNLPNLSASLPLPPPIPIWEAKQPSCIKGGSKCFNYRQLYVTFHAHLDICLSQLRNENNNNNNYIYSNVLHIGYSISKIFHLINTVYELILVPFTSLSIFQGNNIYLPCLRQ